MACAARFFDDATRALAVRTRLRDLEETARGDDLAAPAAHRASDRMRALLRSRAFARLASIQFANLDLLLAAAGGLLEVICMS